MGAVHREKLLLMRNDIAIDKERYNIYRDELLILIVSQKKDNIWLLEEMYPDSR